MRRIGITLQLTPKAGDENYCFQYKKRLLAFILLFTVVTVSFAQSANDAAKIIDAGLLKQDLAILKDSLQKLHGGLYRYKTKKQMDQLFESCSEQLEHPMTLITYYAMVCNIVSEIEDEHTSAFLPGDAIKGLIAQAKFSPLMLRLIGTKAYITCNTKGLIAGSEITTIDHVSVNKLRGKLLGYIPSDGSIKTGKYAQMNDGDDPFFYLYYLVYGEKPVFDVGFIGPDGKKGNIKLQAALFQNIDCHTAPIPISQYLKLSYQPGNVAVLTVKSLHNFKLEKTNENLARFLQDAFAAIAGKHIKKLIIDVRDNGGGEDGNGALLNSYLTDRPFSYYDSIKTTTRKFEVKDHEQLAIQQPHENNFSSPVYVLINGLCFSGTSDFCSIAKKFPNVKFIGEETGGGYHGNTSGARTALELPNTHIKVNVPLWEYFNAVKSSKYKDRGIIPDYTIVPTIKDYLQHKDVQMDLALQLAEKN
ncbi:S41 family peptidase [Mucilaginibacter sp.]|uniref:S41 family peptidase n=1 Tax=Mucilaginibacter sp. TaxID=1882438 RepID=UPI0026085407|nr:S41 family peptidase [Mucilaginibacter sp.]MDB4921010.1 Peptidase family [Mucilaginibacter sp.]